MKCLMTSVTKFTQNCCFNVKVILCAKVRTLRALPTRLAVSLCVCSNASVQSLCIAVFTVDALSTYVSIVRLTVWPVY